MLRKKILGEQNKPPVSREDALNIPALTAVQVTSEAPDFPIDNIFDERGGPGGSRWVAEKPGEQTVILEFDSPQIIDRVGLEIEEQESTRTQELVLSVSKDGAKTYRELLRQEYNFSPPHTTFERESWSINADGVTHLRLWIKPDKGGTPCRAALTSLVFGRSGQ